MPSAMGPASLFEVFIHTEGVKRRQLGPPTVFEAVIRPLDDGEVVALS